MALFVLPNHTWAEEQGCGPFDGLQLPSDSLDILKGGEVVRSHSEWLKKYTSNERESYDAKKDHLRVNLCGAIAVGRSFFVLELDWADLSKSNLQNSNFNGASLEHANFSEANLQNAEFVGTKLLGAFFGDANLHGVRFEPDPSSLPNAIAIRRADGLNEMVFEENPDALMQLREQFKAAGRRDLERQITYAIERSRTLLAWKDGNWIEAAFRFVAYELPTLYGLAPSRALLGIFILFVPFALFYFWALSPKQPDRIWKIYPKDRIGTDGSEIQQPANNPGYKRILSALHFSLVSAFQIGWREMNIVNKEGHAPS